MPSAVTPEMFVACGLSRDPRQVGYAREMTRKTLREWGLAEHADLVELIVSELVTNAILHGAEPIEFRLACDPSRLQVEVHDNGTGRPTQCRTGPEDERGRGLMLIGGLIQTHGGTHCVIDDDAGPGKTIYVSVPLTAVQARRTWAAAAGRSPDRYPARQASARSGRA